MIHCRIRAIHSVLAQIEFLAALMLTKVDGPQSAKNP